MVVDRTMSYEISQYVLWLFRASAPSAMGKEKVFHVLWLLSESTSIAKPFPGVGEMCPPWAVLRPRWLSLPYLGLYLEVTAVVFCFDKPQRTRSTITSIGNFTPLVRKKNTKHTHADPSTTACVAITKYTEPHAWRGPQRTEFRVAIKTANVVAAEIASTPRVEVGTF